MPMAMDAKKRESERGLAEGPPHYYGHRERLRERFREAGADAPSDYELLEMVLFSGAAPERRQAARQSVTRDDRHRRPRIGGRDTKPRCQIIAVGA